MLSFAVKQLKTSSSLRKNRNYIAQLSMGPANPKTEILYMEEGQSTKLQAGSHSFQPQQYKQNQHIQGFKKCFTWGKVFPTKNLWITFKHLVDYLDYWES